MLVGGVDLTHPGRAERASRCSTTSHETDLMMKLSRLAHTHGSVVRHHHELVHSTHFVLEPLLHSSCPLSHPFQFVNQHKWRCWVCQTGNKQHCVMTWLIQLWSLQNKKSEMIDVSSWWCDHHPRCWWQTMVIVSQWLAISEFEWRVANLVCSNSVSCWKQMLSHIAQHQPIRSGVTRKSNHCAATQTAWNRSHFSFFRCLTVVED